LSSTEMIGVGAAAKSSAICEPAVQSVQEVSYRPVRTFERPILANVAATLLVPVYRLFSVAILSAILIGLASYLFLTIFYFFSQAWIEPRIISPTDAQVLQLSGQLAQGTLVREQLVTQRLDLLVKLRDARRKATDSNQFQHEVKQTAKQVVNDNLHRLASVQDVDRSFQSEAPQILDSDKSFASGALAEAEKLYKTHLISEEEWINRKTQLAQLGVSALSLKRSSAELEGEKNVLSREINSYSTLVAAGSSLDGLNSEVLQAKRQLDGSLLDEANAKDLAAALYQEVSMTEEAITRQDRLLLSIQNFPYLRAAEQKLTVAFVPYTNDGKTNPGTPIYGCSLGVLFCRQVGRIEEVLDGEVVDKHPFFNKELRGLLVRVDFKDPKWDRSQVLFLGKAPLFF
jgi:hypothetical protein